MLKKIIKITGLISIILFCAISVALHQFKRDIHISALPEKLKNILSYPTYFEDPFYDHRMNLTLDKNYVDDKLVLAAIDDLSLKKFGRFPWTRLTWAPILKKLKNFGAKAVVFDVIFSEKENHFGETSPDEQFAKAISDFQADGIGKVIIAYSLTQDNELFDDESYKELPDPLFDYILDTKQDGEIGLISKRVSSTTFPIETIIKSSPGLAYINAEEDKDGIFRRYHLVSNIGELYFPSFSLLAYQYLTQEHISLEIHSRTGDATLITPKAKFQLNARGETKIRWVGGIRAFPTIGINQIVEADNDDESMKKALNGKAVFIGSTAFAAHDLRHTPVDTKLPGIYFHMNMTRMLLDGRQFSPIENSIYWSWGILLTGTIAIILISLLSNAILDVFFVLSFVTGAYLLDSYILLPQGHELSLFFAMLSTIACYSWITFWHFYEANKDKQFLKTAFGSYISPELIEMMHKSGQRPSLGGEQKFLTAYFTDIQSFSTFSEKLTPSQLVELLNEYLTAMTDILLEYQGTLDKYEGDAIIAFFGAPLEFDDHAHKAVSVAIKMQKKLLELREKWSLEGDKWPEVVKEMRMRIGVNSGEMVTGNMGSSTRMNYTMMGDAVNLAARLEEAAKQYGIFTYISKATLEATNKEELLYREIDTIRVVGKSEPITTYEILDFKSDAPKELIDFVDRFHKALQLYKSQDFIKAQELFEQLIQLETPLRLVEMPKKTISPSEIYINRCQDFINNPPKKNWDGVFTLTSK